jgi:uncharacterized membrane protein YgdD (TMEM256/DUF423 family)
MTLFEKVGARIQHFAMNSAKFLQFLAGLLGLLAVAAGAFGAHALKKQLSPADLEIWKTGAQYHLIHAVLLAWVAYRARNGEALLLRVSAWCLVAGILIFAGTLYGLVLTQARWLGAITPLGGLSLMAGWLFLAIAGLGKEK